jgi:uncharacterized protein (DUF2062 family)/SAM-dependent methyltransferase
LLRRRIHELARQILQAHAHPGRIAAAVLVGAIVGCTPLFGLHLFVCIALAWLLRLNQVAVYAAANISIPPLVPFIGFASVQLGERILRGRWLSLSLVDFRWGNAPSLAKTFFLDWMVGGVVVGASVGAVGAVVAYFIAQARRSKAGGNGSTIDPIEAALRASREAFARLPFRLRRFRVYASLKYRLDPCYRAIAAHVPAGSFTVDLGSGLGMLPAVLASLGGERRALGIEWDGAKVEAGRLAMDGLDGARLMEGDVRSCEIPPCDVITLVDVLHYYDAAAQRALLQRCRAALRDGGRLLVREGDRERAGAARWTRFVERLATALGWNRGPSVRFRPVAELRADLEALGFAVRVDEVAGKLHPGNVLLLAELTRSPAAATSST